MVLLNLQIQKIVEFLSDIQKEIKSPGKKPEESGGSALLIEIYLQRLKIIVPQHSESQNRLTFMIQKVGVYSHDPEQEFDKKFICDLNLQ